MKKLLLTLTAIAGLTIANVAQAQIHRDDATVRAQLVGYWRSPRHEYLIKADGTMWMLPLDVASRPTGTWSVHNGYFYHDGERMPINVLTERRFVYGGVFKLNRINVSQVGQSYDPSSVR